ncbi:MAG TPA: prolipoprotein diacylglyceryl transferase [Candidatus Latescibacteria bacterium]|nr:prolipoprotein diacylglyceryl transferase [Candidatus Latescibacterota bacterium]HRU24878.1 prolipoprotein diacylglyceryl transferase [Candidatus Latescibacterota bacterium]
MYPELFKIGPVTVYSYGAMLACAFIVGAWLFRRELRRWNLPEDLADRVALAAMFGGIIGAKLYFIALEAPDEFAAEPLNTLFSGAGLTFYGGLAGAVLFIWFVVRRAKVSFLHVADLLGPILVLGYAFGRAGCFLSGDGDYGPPTNLPWGMSFPNGTVPTVLMVHPTPLYEIGLCLVGFGCLWFVLRHKTLAPGVMVAATFLVAGVERLITEFWRFDSGVYATYAYAYGGTSLAESQRVAFEIARKAHFAYAGLSLAQVLSVALIIAGVVILFVQRRKPARAIPGAVGRKS